MLSWLVLSWPTLAAFAAASLLLAITPGPGVVYIVARTLAQGQRAGLISVAGVALGNLGNAIGASLGLAALFAVSALAFTVVKFVGALYLVWLGIRAWRSAPTGTDVGAAAANRVDGVFRDGALVALLNPKTALFFAAFLPQFIDPSASPIRQSLALGAAFVAIAAASDSLYVLVASRASRALGRTAGGVWARGLTAATYFGLAAFTLATGSRASR